MKIATLTILISILVNLTAQKNDLPTRSLMIAELVSDSVQFSDSSTFHPDLQKVDVKPSPDMKFEPRFYDRLEFGPEDKTMLAFRSQFRTSGALRSANC